MLVKALDEPRVQAVCEYSEVTESAEWTIRYGGGRLNPAEGGGKLETSLLRGITKEIRYTWTGEEPLPNQLELKLTQGCPVR